MSEPFSKSVQKRIEAQTGDKTYTEAEYRAGIEAAQEAVWLQILEWKINEYEIGSKVSNDIQFMYNLRKKNGGALAAHDKKLLEDVAGPLVEALHRGVHLMGNRTDIASPIWDSWDELATKVLAAYDACVKDLG